MSEERLRILVVDDTVTYRAIVSAALAEVPGVEVVGVAANGKIALAKVAQLQPDLLTLDLEMPEMDGLEVLRRLRPAAGGVGAIVLSALSSQGAQATMTALGLGAFDFVLKPSGATPQDNAEQLRRELRLKIEAFRRSRQIRTILCGEAAGCLTPLSPRARTPRALGERGVGGDGKAGGAGEREEQREARPRLPLAAACPKVVALGVSTGGPQALTCLLPQLPADLPAAVLIVQHMPPVFTRSSAEDLDRRCALRVCEAADGQAVLAGSILIAPGGKQMKVEQSDGTGVVCITDDPPENSCRPSVDYLFRSVAEVYGPAALGVIMTGMGSDGARGCRRMHAQGAAILAQDEASCVVFGMPREPIREGLASAIPLAALAREIARRVGKGVVACR